MLEISCLNAYYDAIVALREVSLKVERKTIVALLGANGAGKSTLLDSIMGGPVRTEGSIRFEDREILGKKTEDVVASGIALIPEGRQIFPELTVYENISMGAYLRRDKAGIKKDLVSVYELFPRLVERNQQIAATLSGGEQQMLAIARGLMSKPKLMLLDEPSLGLAPILVTEIMLMIKQINEQNVTILLVEQNVRQALRISNEAYVLEKGQVVMRDEAVKLSKDPHVISAYLGEA